MLNQIDINTIQNLIYIIASVMFIYGIKMLGKEATAVKGNFISALAMFLAVGVTVVGVINPHIILGGIALGAIVGSVIAIKVNIY